MNAREMLALALDQEVLLYLRGDKLKFKAKVGALGSELKQKIKTHRRAMIDLLLENEALGKHQRSVKPKIKRQNLSVAELSFAQQRLWFIDKLQGSSSQYNMSAAFEINGQFDVTVASRALTVIIERHEVLRSVYRHENGETLQVINEPIDFVIEQHDLSQNQQRQTLLSELLSQNAEKSFDLSQDLMVRACYINLFNETQPDAKMTTNNGVLFFNMHHIASDGWSIEVLIKEFVLLYKDLVQGGTANVLPPLDIQYSDYAIWQKSWLRGEILAKHQQYWQSQLVDLPSVHSLNTDNHRPKIKQQQGARVTSRWPTELAIAIQNGALSFNITPFMLLHGALALMLSRHGNHHDIVIGAPVANRMQTELGSLIGFFVNTLALRIDTQHLTLEAYLSHVKQVNLDALEHQDMPFDHLLETIEVERSSAYSPVFQIMLTMNNNFGQDEQLPGQRFNLTNLTNLTITPMKIDRVLAKFDLEIEVNFDPEGVEFSWVYDVNLFERRDIEKFNLHFQRLLRAMIEQPLAELKDLPMLDKGDIHQILSEYNQTDACRPSQTLQRLFETQAALTPDHTALVFEQKTLTYRALNEAANKIAHRLVDQGVGPDTIVGLAFERSLEMIVAMLGILKANGAYLPLDCELPQARLQYMCEDAQMKHLLIQSHLANVFEISDHILVTALDISKMASQFANCADSNLPEHIKELDSNLIYTIYTSGSTGLPKGVMVEHNGVVNRLDWMCKHFPLAVEDKVLHKTPFSFDVSVWEIFWPLISGASLVIAKPGGHKEPNYLSELITSEKINALHFVPSMLNVYLSVPNTQFPPCVRYVFCSGEALDISDVKTLQSQAPHVALHNFYGPTEASIEVSHFDCSTLGNADCVPIGKPIQNVKLYILDTDMNCCPLGGVGELYIGGVAVARDYLNGESFTEQVFMADPFANNPSARMYKSGDLVRYSPEGNIVYLGRADDQIKIRGFRVELGEIENKLSLCQGVSACAVIADDNIGGKRLIAYVIMGDSAADKLEAVAYFKQHLRGVLPEYMVPSAFVIIEKMPLTPSGKINRQALPKADSALTGQPYRPATTDTQRVLVDIWAGLFAIPPKDISINSNFFDLGGHSLLVVKCVSEIQVKFGIEVALKDVFEQVTIELLSAVVDMELSILKLGRQQQEAVITSEGFL